MKPEATNNNTTLYMYTQKQCINCRRFYTELENNYNVTVENQKPVCYYHRTATCCKSLRVKGGCIKALKHTEDLGYSAIVAKFPFHRETLDIYQQTHKIKNKGVDASAADTTSEDEDEDEVQSDDRFIVHRVEFTDTLIGISLFYQVKVEDIQKANKLDSHQIFHHKILFIPRPNTPSVVVRPVRPVRKITVPTEAQIKGRRRRQIKTFQQIANVDEEEAEYYLEVSLHQTTLFAVAGPRDLRVSKILECLPPVRQNEATTYLCLLFWRWHKLTRRVVFGARNGGHLFVESNSGVHTQIMLQGSNYQIEQAWEEFKKDEEWQKQNQLKPHIERYRRPKKARECFPDPQIFTVGPPILACLLVVLLAKR